MAAISNRIALQPVRPSRSGFQLPDRSRSINSGVTLTLRERLLPPDRARSPRLSSRLPRRPSPNQLPRTCLPGETVSGAAGQLRPSAMNDPSSSLQSEKAVLYRNSMVNQPGDGDIGQSRSSHG